MSKDQAQRFWSPRIEAAGLQKPDQLTIWFPASEQDSERWDGQSADEIKRVDSCAAVEPGGDTDAAHWCQVYKDFYEGVAADGLVVSNEDRALIRAQEKKVYDANQRALASFDMGQGAYLKALAKISFPTVEESSNPIGDTPESEWEAGLCPRGGYDYFITPDSASSRGGGFLVLRNREGVVDTTTGLRLFSCDGERASLGDPVTLEEAKSASSGIAAWFREQATGYTVTGLELTSSQ